MVKLALTIALAAAFVAPTAGGGTKAAACHVSSTSSHPVLGRTGFNVGNARIAVGLPPGATFPAIPDGSPRGGWAFIQKNGWIRVKVGWFTKHGTPRVTGRRVDGTGRALRADVGPLTTDNGPFYPSLLYFPSFGCWRITATAGGAELSAIVSVTRER
jgi:hypothetical protein